MSFCLKTVDADTLLSTPLERTEYLVDGLIPYGVSIFCGSSKIGKSWLMLWLGLQIARGYDVWGASVKQCDVLYLCLEDTVSRIQNRLYHLTETAPETLRFAVLSHPLGNGFEEEVQNHILNYPETKLVIVDTLQKIRCGKRMSGRNGMYGDDYDDISSIKQIADKLQIGIMLVHHVRKLNDPDDPFHQVSGSTGITGAADTIFLLRKDEDTSDIATLLVKGRDIEIQQLKLKFVNCVWQLLEKKNQEEMRREEIPQFLYRLKEYILACKEWKGTATELVDVLGEREITATAVTRCLNRFYYEVLEPCGIRYATGRTGSKRWIRLYLSDGNDRSDGKFSVEELLSLPSQTVTGDYSKDEIVL